MPLTMKEAAEELLKIADAIEVEADKVAEFVCDKCNHTATLADINGKRETIAKEASEDTGREVVVAKISVNDKVHCPACDGVMTYKATEASSKFYFAEEEEEKAEEKKEEPAEKAEEKVEEKAEEKKATEEKKAEEASPIDYDSLERYAAKK